MSFVDLTAHPGIHVRLRPGCRITVSADEAAFMLEMNGTSRRLGPARASLASVLPALTEGAPLATLRDIAIEAGGAFEAARLLLWVQRLSLFQLLDYPLHDGDRRIAVVVPQRPGVVPLPVSEDGQRTRSLSRFAFLRRDGAGWLLEHPLAGARIAFVDPAAAASVMQPGAPDAPAYVLDVLAGLGFFDDPGAGAERDAALTQWEFHDLAFHFHSRLGWHADPVGGLFPFVGRLAPLPAIRPAWPGERIPLQRAAEGAASAPLSDVVRRRRSHRKYSSAPTLGELGVFLDRVARVRATWPVPVTSVLGGQGALEVSSRPYPNGGASYELEIYPVVEQCEGLEPGLYHYDAGAHELVRVSGRTNEVTRLLAMASVSTAGQAAPQVLLTITARFPRVMWKYRSIAYAVILRNTGVLYQAMYLAATDMGLSPCGLGSGDSALFAAATGLDPVVEGTVGEFLLGGRPLE